MPISCCSHTLSAVLALLLGAGLGTAAQKNDVQGEWKRRSVPVAKLTADLPFDPPKLLPDPSMRKQNEAAQGVRVQVNKTIFRFSYLEYADGSEVDLERAAQAALSNLANTSGVSGLKFSRTDLKLGPVPAIRLETSYEFGGQRLISFWIVIAGEGKRLWQGSAMFSTTEEDQRALARRVLDSIRLDK